MAISRKDFFKTVCLSGACLCGFGTVAFAANPSEENEPDEDKQQIFKEWIASLLVNLDSNLQEPETRKLIKSCAISHYNNLKMDEVLAEYKGDLQRFISWVEESWGWKVAFDEEAKTIVADEAKNYCVCPMIKHDEKNKYPALCYCSEGFAERMFSTVIGKPVFATVISSIQRGDESCKYKIMY